MSAIVFYCRCSRRSKVRGFVVGSLGVGRRGSGDFVNFQQYVCDESLLLCVGWFTLACMGKD